MFFVLSKTVGILLLPSNFLISLGILGLILTLTRFAALGRKLTYASLALLAICGFSPLGNWLLYPLEQRVPPWNAAQGAPDGIVVLGGSIDAELSAAHGVTVFSGAVDRIITASMLAHRYPKARIVLSGGNPNLVTDDVAKEADQAAAILESLGVFKERLILERRSRNTQENAAFSKALVSPKPGEQWLLVTSAYHMPRSIGIFRKAGFAVQPYPVDWRMRGRADLLTFSPFLLDGLARVDTASREWLGLAAYWATGKTDAFFPAPNPG